jgi:hypothetical protein
MLASAAPGVLTQQLQYKDKTDTWQPIKYALSSLHQNKPDDYQYHNYMPVSQFIHHVNTENPILSKHDPVNGAAFKPAEHGFFCRHHTAG